MGLCPDGQEGLVWPVLFFGLGFLAAWALGVLRRRPLEQVKPPSPDLGEQGDVIDAMVCEVTAHQEQLYLQNKLLESQVLELRRIQDQLIVADRRASVGTLSAGVAHEINNPLAYITANIQFAAQELRRMVDEQASGTPSVLAEEDGREMIDALTEAHDGCSRVQHIVQSLKSFSCGDDGKHEPLELTPALKTAINMASNEIRHRARLVQDYAFLATVDANQVRLAQVFLNLLINAAHAIAPGAVEQNEIRVTTRQEPDGRVRVSITDTGGGMTPEVRGRLFTPFFTTKPVGVGTGLGLSVCQGIVHGMGGQIEVQSEVGRGSTFSVILPLSTATTHASHPVALPSLKTQRVRILVVDDEPRVGMALRRALSREHDVCVTSGAREALAHVCQGSPFDVILCDVMMPGMTGIEFFAELQRTDASQAGAVLFLTGGALTPEANDFLTQHPGRILSKPLDMDFLRERLRVLLEQRRPAAPVSARASARPGELEHASLFSGNA